MNTIPLYVPDDFQTPDGSPVEAGKWRYEIRPVKANELFWTGWRWCRWTCTNSVVQVALVAIPVPEKEKVPPTVKASSAAVGRAFGEANGDVSFVFPSNCLPGPGQWGEVMVKMADKVVGES